MSFGFDTSNYKPAEDSGGFILIPDGTYPAALTNVDPRSDGADRWLWCEFTIREGEHKGRRVWTGFTTHNSDASRQEKGRRMLAQLLAAADRVGATSPHEVLNVPLTIRVGSWKEKNRVYAFSAYEPAASADAAAFKSDDDIPF